MTHIRSIICHEKLKPLGPLGPSRVLRNMSCPWEMTPGRTWPRASSALSSMPSTGRSSAHCGWCSWRLRWWRCCLGLLGSPNCRGDGGGRVGRWFDGHFTVTLWWLYKAIYGVSYVFRPCFWSVCNIKSGNREPPKYGDFTNNWWEYMRMIIILNDLKARNGRAPAHEQYYWIEWNIE